MRLWGTEILSTLHNNLFPSHFQAHNPRGWNPVSGASSHNGVYISPFRSPHIIPRILINTNNIFQARWIATPAGKKKIFPRHPTQKTFVNTIYKIQTSTPQKRNNLYFIHYRTHLCTLISIFYAALYSAVNFLIKLDKLNCIVL